MSSYPRQLIVLLLVLASCDLTFAQGRDLTPDRVNSRVQSSAVEILINGRLSGSGAVIDRSGIVVTAAHVVADPNARIQVLFPDHRKLTAQIHAKDAGHDVILLTLPKQSTGYVALQPARRTVTPGSKVFMVGSPLFRHRQLFTGTVTQAHTSAEFLNPQYVEVFYIQASSPHGTSGAAWVNGQGQYIGIQSAMLWVKDAPQGIAFASPLSAIEDLLRNPRIVGTPSAGFAVEELWEQSPEFLANVPPELNGLVIRFLLKGSPFEQAKIPTGTIITHIDAKALNTRDEFVKQIRRRKIDDTIQFTVRDANGKNERIIEMKLGKLQ